jgi:teichuronic acid biosynthesis glycosyltransferase TuaC
MAVTGSTAADTTPMPHPYPPPPLPIRSGAVRVLVVTNLWPTAERPASGGFVRDQVEALRRIDGLEVELFTFGTGARAYAGAARELRRRYRGERFDVVHAHYGLTGWSALAVRGAPHVVTFHGTDLQHSKVGPLSRLLVKRIALPAPVSAALARVALPRGTRVAILPTGVNLDRFAPMPRRQAREHLGLDPDRPYLLFPADPARPEKRYDRARELADAAGIELIHYERRVPEEVPFLINAANAVLVTSEREGFGLAALEALACGVPVLSTDVGIAPLALRGIEGTLCGPFDRGRWQVALAPHVSAQDPRVDGRGRAALFDRNRLAERVFMAYRDVLGTGQATP